MSESALQPLVLPMPNEAGWPLKSLDDLCKLISRGTAPSYVEHSSVLAIGQRCVTSSNFAPEFARPHSPHAMRNVLRPERGDVLLNSTGTGTIGRSVVFDNEGAFIVDGHVTVIRPKTDMADGRWLNAVLRTPWGQSHLERFCYAGSTNQLELSRTPVKASIFPVPTLTEQKCIAKILDTFNTAIRESESVMYKLNAVKQGLLHDLLTRGIDTNGELRPPQSEAPQLYQESPLGWIPKEWRNTRLGKVASLQRGHDIVETDLVLGPYPVISSSGLVGYHNSSTSRGPNVVVGRKGSIGTVHYLETDFWAHDTSLFVTNFFGNNERFVFHLFNYLKLAQYGTKSGSPSLNRNDIHPLPVALPKLVEQILIVQVLASHEENMKRSELERDKLMKTKSALMEDLLTGRIRVTPLLERAAT